VEGKPHYEVTAAVLRRDGRILLTRRPAGSHLAGRWEFPGGKREPGESLPDALTRELAEELTIAVRVGERIEQVHHEYDDRVVDLHFFACRLVAGVPAPVGCDALAWVPPAMLKDHPMPPADAAFVQRLMAEG
jgi:8-oxo-dGTP diphosphatase